MRGIVMEIDSGTAVVMKNNGVPDTLRAKPGWQVGDVVAIPGKAISFKALAAVAASFVLLATLLFSGYSIYNTQTTLISIDVNPSIELSINRFDRVIAARGLNPEAEQILADLSLNGLPYTEAVALLMGNEALDGYIGANAFLVFSVQTNDTSRQDNLLAGLQEAAGTAVLSHHTDATIEYLLVDGQVVENAHGHGMSAGKYTLVQELAGLVPGLDVDAYYHHSVGDIQEEINSHGHGNQNGHKGTNQGGHNGGNPACICTATRPNRSN